MYNLPTPVGFSYTIINNNVILRFALDDRLKDDRVFLKRGHVFQKDGHLFLWCMMCRKYPVYHTPLLIVDLQLVFPVYEMQVVSGTPLYIRARV